MLSTTHVKFSRIIYCTLCFTILTGILGCGDSADQKIPEDPCSGLSTTYGHLAYLRKTTHPELRKEYALLVEQKHTPCQLLEINDKASKTTASEFNRILDVPKEEILRDTYFLSQNPQFQFSSLHRAQIKDLATKYEAKISLIDEALELQKCCFEYDHTQGLMAKDTFITQVWAAVRLEEIAAANYFYNTDNKEEEIQPETNSTNVDPALQKTIGCIESIFKLAERLGRVKYVGARLNAATIRKEVGKILEALVHDPRCNKATLIELQKIIQNELTHWQSDSEMWIGDRALGLYIYEVVRDGQILSILDETEEEVFRQEGTLRYLTDVTQETADEDQLYYLKTMRDVINKCRHEFHQRPLLGPKILEDLKSRKNQPDYPIVAAKMLLSEIDNGLLLQMVDLARTRAWSVALTLAIGETPRDNINPLNGEPYYITNNKKVVIVRILPEDEKVDLQIPLDQKARDFIVKQIDQSVVVPKPEQ